MKTLPHGLADSPQGISEMIAQSLIYPYCSVAMASLLIYDYFITLDREVEHIWKMRLSWGKILFFLNRYLPFGLIPLIVHGFFFERNPERCRKETVIGGMIIYFSYGLAVIILLRRAFIAWERRAVIGTLVVSVFFASLAESAYTMNSLINGIRIISTPAPIRPCVIVTLDSTIWLGMVNLIVLDVVALGLLLVKSYLHFRSVHSNLMQTMVRDGVGYFVCNTILTLTNFVIIKSTNPFMNHFFAEIQGILQSVLCTRLLLHIHIVAAELPEQPVITEFTTCPFTETIESMYTTGSFYSPESRRATLPVAHFRRRMLQSSVE